MPEMSHDVFNEAYWLSKPPAVRAIRSVPTCSPERWQAAMDLVKAGYIIDPDIEVSGLQPYETMYWRKYYGYTWIPKFPDAPSWTLMPGITGLPGIPYDPTNAPKDSIKVSLDSADYPPYDPPRPITLPIPVEAKPWWERPLGSGKYAVRIGDTSPDGTISSGYVKRVKEGPFGSWSWWEESK